MNYFDQEGVVLNTNYARYSGRFNYETDISSKLRLTTSLFASRSNEDKLFGNTYGGINFSGALASLFMTSPIIPIYNEDGSYNISSPFTSSPTNIIQDINAVINETYVTRYLSNAGLEYKIIDGLVFKSTIGADILNTKQNFYAPTYTSLGFSTNGSASIGSVNALSLLNENTLTYSADLNDDHELTALAGYTIQSTKHESYVAGAQNFTNDLVTFKNLSLAGTALLPSSNAVESGLNSYLARLSYTYLGKYSITVSGRADGSSRLGKNNKWGYFPSVGLAWNISDEHFFKGISQTTDLKLRGSWGRTGNSEVPPYSSLASLTATNYYFNGTLVTGISPNQIANPDLKWETTSQYDFGVDLSLFNRRLNLVFDWYDKKTTDLLLNLPFPNYTGYTSVLKNVGSVRNSGIELSLQSYNIRTSNFTWDTQVTYAANKNEILNLGEGVASYFPIAPTGQVSPVIVSVGLPVATFWGYRTDGLLTADDLANNTPILSGSPQQVGDLKYVDTNGDGVVTTADKVDLGSAQPKFTFGINNNLTFKSFDLSFFLQGTYGNRIFNLLRQQLEIPTLSQNVSADLANRWRESNPNGTVPRATNSPVPQVIDRHVEDASYIRLRTLTFGYKLPTDFLSRYSNKQIRLFVTGQNLFTITNYSGLNPETNFYETDNTKQGIDFGVYPANTSFLAGLNITF